MLTGTKPDRHTVALAFAARIGGKTVSITLPEMQDAVAPRYLGPRDLVMVDLTSIPDRPSECYWRTGADAIRTRTSMLYEQSFENGPVRHVSVFALGPIPLLVHLGACLSDKVPWTLYQRHRDTQTWRWKEKGDIVTYEHGTIRNGTSPTMAALVLSLSGRVREEDLPADIDDRFSVYEIKLADMAPTPPFLDREESLHSFRDVYVASMRRIAAVHPRIEQLHLFPAIPAPVAVALGLDLLPKRDPAVLIYDYDKQVGGFVPALKVNNDERE